MNESLTYILVAVAAGLLAFAAAWILARRIGKKSLDSARAEAQKLMDEAKKEAEIKKKEATLQAREDFLWINV